MKKERILYSLFVFLYLYMPPFTSRATIHYIGIIAWVYLIISKKITKVNLITVKRFFFLVVAVIYVEFRTLISGGQITDNNGILYLLVYSIPIAYALDIYARNIGLLMEDVLLSCVYVATFQGILAIGSFINPNIHSFFVGFMENINSTEFINRWAIQRLYGLSVGMTFSMPVFQATIGVLTLFYSLEKKIWYVLLVPVIWSAGILNARISLVIIFIGGLLILSYYLIINRKKINKLFTFVLISIVVIVIGQYVLSNIDNQLSKDWIQEGVDNIVSFITGQGIPFLSVYYSSTSTGIGLRELPAGFSLIFGNGSHAATDIGYIHDIWMGGLLYAILIYFWFSRLCIESTLTLKKSIGKPAVLMGVLLFVVAFLVNMKGYTFVNSEYMHFVLLMFITILYSNISWKKQG